MLRTLRITMITLVGLLVIAVAILFWARQSGVLDPQRQNQNQAEPYKIGAPFELVSHRGETITQAALANKPIAVFFGFTSCPEVCPTTLYDVNRWMDRADPGGDKVEAFFVTVDPERDLPENLNSYVSFFSDRITGITGEPQAVWDLAKAWNVFHEKRPYSDDPSEGYDINHTASVFLVDASGNFRGTISYGEDDNIAIAKMKNIL